MEIDPQLRDHTQSTSQSYPSLPHFGYSHSLKLPPPQHHQPPQPPWPTPAHAENSLFYPRPHASSHASSHPQPETSSHYDATHHQAEQPSVDSKRPRACEACRGLKVRCEPDHVQGTCRRCAKAGRNCVVTAPSRKRQKKTDSRVAELEKKIDALTASLHATKAQGFSESDDDSVEDRKQMPAASGQSFRTSDYVSPETQRTAELANKLQQSPSDFNNNQNERVHHHDAPSNDRKRRVSQYLEDESGVTVAEAHPKLLNEDPSDPHPPTPSRGQSSTNPPVSNGNLNPMPSISYSGSPTHEYADVVDRKILDASLASELFQHYVHNMARHMPLVVFPPDTPAGAIRKHKATLFLAILSVASGQEHPDIQRVLAKEIMRTFVDKVLKGERSLELIQAMQVFTVWYWPEENRDAQTYQIIHIAAVMAVDVGLGRRPKGNRESYQALWKEHPRSKASENVETWRAWLGCYWLCANAAMGLKRPNLLRWNSHLDDCLENLSRAHEGLPSDSILAQLVRLQRLADDVGNQISFDEPAAIGMSDKQTQYALKAFERQMGDWEQQTSKPFLSPALTFNFHVANLYMHEFAMHLDQALDIPSPSPRREQRDAKCTARPEPLTTAHVGALTTCLTSIHGLFDTFLRLTIEDIRTLPVFYFVRVSHAVVLLIKMYFAATAADSELGKVISSNELRAEEYIGRLREQLQTAAASDQSRPARSFFLVVHLLRTWFEQRRNGKGDFGNETAKRTRIEAQPVDVEKQAAKGEYKRMQLNEDTTPARRLSTAAPKPATGIEGMDQSRLHVLGEVALGNSSSNAHGMKQGNEHWHAYPTAPIGAPANPYGDYDYGPTMGPAMAGGYDMGMHGFQPGLEQAIGMTFNEGSLSYMDDYALYNMMQTPSMFENIAG